MRTLFGLIIALALSAGCSHKTPSGGFLFPKGIGVKLTDPAGPPVPCPVRFVDIAHRAGLSYRWSIPGPRPLNILQGIGTGCAFLDFDNDGNLDILLVGEHPALFQGDGHGHFVDVTRRMGLTQLHGHFLGCAVGDYDNDGFDDIYLSGYGVCALLRNDHGKCFVDVTKAIGLGPLPWGTSAAFVDVDGDGYLDLYVAGYLQFGPKDRQLCPEHGFPTTCPPNYYRSQVGTLYQNIGGRSPLTPNNGGTGFVDITRSVGLSEQSGNGLGVATQMLDGKVNLAIANDEEAGDLFVSKGAEFVNTARTSGTAYDRYGHPHAGMGIDWGDVDNDGRPDLFLTTFRAEIKPLYHNDGGGLFHEASEDVGIAKPLLTRLSFGCKLLDADDDGWLDLLVASGHVRDNIARIDSSASYREPITFLHNRGRSALAFDDASASAELTSMPPIVGRGLATGDFDNDGRVDAVVVDAEGAPVLLHNETPPAGRHWIGFRLHGRGRTNADGYGARLTVSLAEGQLRSRECEASGSYLSSSDKRVLIGLGNETATSVTVVWPDGRVDARNLKAVDRYVDIDEARQ